MKIIFSILFLTFITCANAQTCEGVLEKKTMLIGERNQLNIKIKQFSSVVNLPEKLKLKGFVSNKKEKKRDTFLLEISSVIQDSLVKNEVQNIYISFTVWDTGYVTILPLTLDSINQIVVPPSLLLVAFPKVNMKGDIKDIKAGKVDLDAITKSEKEASSWFYFALGAGIVALIAIILFFILRKKKKTEEPIVEQSLYEQTKINLDKLIANKWWEKNETKRHFIELTDIIRSYVGKNYKIEAMEKTTNELKYALKSKNVPSEHIDLLIKLLIESDLVKFAKQTMIPEEIISINNRAYLFLKLTYKEIENSEETNA